MKPSYSPYSETISTLLEAILPHVVFDGWGDDSFAAAVADTEIDSDLAHAACPRGGLDLAIAFHRAGDLAMVGALESAELSDMRFRDKVAHAVWLRLQSIEDKEAVRRGTTLFALPHLAPEGAKLIWETADHIWTALGDTSEDINWYSKRATLSGVYASTVLFWLGDESLDSGATRSFLDRRIDNVMQIEIAKAKARENPLLKPLTQGLERAFSVVKAPNTAPRTDVPGRWDPQETGQK
ncbi:MAG: COQ9 family protein [Pseudoruegeria sp.]